jgi:hypothetical protein
MNQELSVVGDLGQIKEHNLFRGPSKWGSGSGVKLSFELKSYNKNLKMHVKILK